MSVQPEFISLLQDKKPLTINIFERKFIFMTKMTVLKAFGYTVAVGTGLQIVKKIPIILDCIISSITKRKFPDMYDMVKEKIEK